MKVVKGFFQVISWIFIGIIALLIIFTVASNNILFGGYSSFLIQSGSMEPSIMTGDVIVVHTKESYAQRDVITFHTVEGRIVTHRIVQLTQKGNTTRFVTKGDANVAEDEGTITQENIVGAVILVVPKLGFLVAFTKSLPGLIILILIPAFTLVFDEVIGFFRRD